MKSSHTKMRLMRIVWLAAIALVVVTWLTLAPTARADGGGAVLPVNQNDSTDSTSGYIGPDTVSVVSDNIDNTTFSVLWEIWGLLF